MFLAQEKNKHPSRQIRDCDMNLQSSSHLIVDKMSLMKILRLTDFHCFENIQKFMHLQLMHKALSLLCS